jgi:hypothetical protein
MIIDLLSPRPTNCEAFKRNRGRFVPDRPGCYVLANFLKMVMYIGLSVNLRRRMNEHLDDSKKIGETSLGRVIVFHWIESPEINKIERTWMNIYIQHEGALPLLNKVYSPTST